MENQLIIGALIFIGLAGFIFFLKRNQKQQPIHTDILDNEEYKVKGQWDR